MAPKKPSPEQQAAEQNEHDRQAAAETSTLPPPENAPSQPITDPDQVEDEGGTKLKAPPRGNRAAKDKDATTERRLQVVPDPPPRDGAQLDEKHAVECPVCQYRFDPRDPRLAG